MDGEEVRRLAGVKRAGGWLHPPALVFSNFAEGSKAERTDKTRCDMNSPDML